VQRWEYLTVLAADLWLEHPYVLAVDEQAYARGECPYRIVLAQLGGLGWELVGVAGGHERATLFFKRPLRED
jgi:hypothetical protein